MTDSASEYAVTRPDGSMSMRQESVSRSSPSFSEQMPLDSSSGSMGMTRSAKYTLVPRSRASRSIALPGRT